MCRMLVTAAAVESGALRSQRITKFAEAMIFKEDENLASDEKGLRAHLQETMKEAARMIVSQSLLEEIVAERFLG